MSHVSTSIRNCGPEERAIAAEVSSPSVRSPTTHNWQRELLISIAERREADPAPLRIAPRRSGRHGTGVIGAGPGHYRDWTATCSRAS